MTPTAPEVTRLKPCPWCGGETQWGYSSGAKTYFYCIKCRAHVHFHNGDSSAEETQLAALWNNRTLSDPDKWAVQNPEAWEALRTGRAGVYEPYPDCVLVDTLMHARDETPLYQRLDKPFKSEAKEGVCGEVVSDSLDPSLEKNWRYHDEYEFWYMPYPGTEKTPAEMGVRARDFKPWENI